MNFRTIILIAPLAGLAAAATPSHATDYATASVSYADLDLASPGGVRTFDQRLTRATRSVCGDRWSKDLGGYKEYTSCVRETGARVRMQRQRVIAAYLARTGERLAQR